MGVVGPAEGVLSVYLGVLGRWIEVMSGEEAGGVFRKWGCTTSGTHESGEETSEVFRKWVCGTLGTRSNGDEADEGFRK